MENIAKFLVVGFCWGCLFFGFCLFVFVGFFVVCLFFFPATNNKCTYQARLKYKSGLGQLLDGFRKTLNNTVKKSVILLTYNYLPF